MDTIAEVFTAVNSLISGAVTTAIGTIVTYPILLAPAVVGVTGIVLGKAKGLFRIGGKRR